jgi:hypothetical protein
MELKDLIKKHDITLSPEVFFLCEQGIEIMRNAADLSHSHYHIERILNDLDALYTNEASIQNTQIDFEALLPAICWHDTWRSQIVTSNLLSGTYVLFKDGYGSSKLFAKEAEKTGIDAVLIKKITHIINKHSWFQKRGIKHIEAHVLKDIDELELFSITRLKEIELTYLKTNSTLSKGFIKGLHTFYKKFLKPYSTERLHFNWTKNELLPRREQFMLYVGEYLAKHNEIFTEDCDIEALEDIEIETEILRSR